MAVVSSRVAQSRRWMVLPDGWDSGWKAARAAVGSTPAQVMVIGDSDAQGFNTTNHMTKAFPYLLRDKLVAKYGSYADYYPITHSARYETITVGPAPAGTQPWTFDTTWGTNGSLNLNGLGFTMFQDGVGTYPATWVNAGTGTFVTPYACTDFDLIYHDFNTTTTWKYNVDNAAGAGLVTVTNDGRNSMRRVPVTGQTNAVHTVRFGASGSALALGLNGVVTYNVANAKARGIGFANISGLGMRVLDWMTSVNAMPDDRIRQLQGRYKTAPATTLETGFGFPTQPHLAIIELGINDCQYSGGLVQFRSGLRRMCDAIRRGRDNSSILFLICPNPDANTTDIGVGGAFARAESWSLYADQIYGIAAEYQAAVLNVHADWMSTPVAQGFVNAFDPHPNDVGHQNIADTIASIVV